MFSSTVVNVWLSADTVHFDFGRHFAVPLIGRFPTARPGRFDGPGVAVSGHMTFPIERESLDIIAKDELVLSPPASSIL